MSSPFWVLRAKRDIWRNQTQCKTTSVQRFNCTIRLILRLLVTFADESVRGLHGNSVGASEISSWYKNAKWKIPEFDLPQRITLNILRTARGDIPLKRGVTSSFSAYPPVCVRVICFNKALEVRPRCSDILIVDRRITETYYLNTFILVYNTFCVHICSLADGVVFVIPRSWCWTIFWRLFLCNSDGRFSKHSCRPAVFGSKKS